MKKAGGGDMSIPLPTLRIWIVMKKKTEVEMMIMETVTNGQMTILKWNTLMADTVRPL